MQVLCSIDESSCELSKQLMKFMMVHDPNEPKSIKWTGHVQSKWISTSDFQIIWCVWMGACKCCEWSVTPFSVFLLSIHYFSRENFNRIMAADCGLQRISIEDICKQALVQSSRFMNIPEKGHDRVTTKHCLSLSSAVSQNDVSFYWR